MKPGSQGLYKNGIKNVRNYFQIPSLLSVHMIKDMEYHNNFNDFQSYFYTYLTYPAESALNSVNYTHRRHCNLGHRAMGQVAFLPRPEIYIIK